MGKATSVDDKMDELRDLIREANGTLKDIRQERKLIYDLMAKHLKEVINTVIMLQVEECFQEYKEELGRAIEEGVNAIYERFEIVSALCLGKDYDSTQKGLKPLEELVTRYMESRGGKAIYPEVKK